MARTSCSGSGARSIDTSPTFNLDAAILETIEKWVIASLRAGPFTQISTHAAFREFHRECLAAGLPSEYTIHSCLKQRQHPQLLFLHAPYVALAGALQDRIPNRELAEELIRREAGGVDYDVLRQTVCGRMGLKDFQFDQIAAGLENVLRTDKGFLHVDYFDGKAPGVSALVRYVKRKLAGDSHLSAHLIHARQRVACRRLGIDGPRMLHSVLLRYGRKVFAESPFPVLTKRPAEDAAASNFVIDQVRAFLRDERRPVSRAELRKRFAARQGFSHGAVMNATSADAVLRHVPGMLVHLETLGWNADKQAQLVRLAEQYYRNRQRAGDGFARADLLLKLHENDLPPLAGKVAWTALLLAELLGREPRLRIFGNKHNAFVFDAAEQSLESFGDFVALVLEKHFHGAATLEELSVFLRGSGVVVKRVTPAMLARSKRLVLGDKRIAVKEVT